MHLFIIPSKILNEIFNILLVENSSHNFVFHIIREEECNILKFQSNYDNNVYISYSLQFKFLIDIQEFNSIALNYEQCKTLQRLTYMYESSIGLIYSEGVYDVFVSHTNIKLIMYIDETLDQEYIYPPPPSNIEYVEVDIEKFYNCIKLVANPQYLTLFKMESLKNQLIFGDEIQSILQLKKDKQKLETAEIYINPDHILKYLSYLKDLGRYKSIKIKINKNIAYTMYFNTEIGEVFYYNGHDTDPNVKIVNM